MERTGRGTAPRRKTPRRSPSNTWGAGVPSSPPISRRWERPCGKTCRTPWSFPSSRGRAWRSPTMQTNTFRAFISTPASWERACCPSPPCWGWRWPCPCPRWRWRSGEECNRPRSTPSPLRIRPRRSGKQKRRRRLPQTKKDVALNIRWAARRWAGCWTRCRRSAGIRGSSCADPQRCTRRCERPRRSDQSARATAGGGRGPFTRRRSRSE
mmetsp:Transcript_30673/g.70208  ORF Transcript_30673/g.70208 Transcript_30673/m.70208 type:complete len:211 (+) Transcript_30673:1072-1704(+)